MDATRKHDVEEKMMKVIYFGQKIKRKVMVAQTVGWYAYIYMHIGNCMQGDMHGVHACLQRKGVSVQEDEVMVACRLEVEERNRGGEGRDNEEKLKIIIILGKSCMHGQKGGI